MSTGNDGRTRSDVLLVGSMPYDDVEQVFRAAGPALRGHAGWLPDGEVNERKNWVGMLPQFVYPENPALEETMAPPEHELEQPDRDEARPPVEDIPGIWNWRVRPGAQVRFDNLRYGSFARNSYGVFKRLREEGVIEEGVRFQVCLPAPNSAINGFFEDPSQWPELHRAYQEGIDREIGTMLETIPAGDLVIQYDLAWELVDLAMGERNFFAFWPKRTLEQKVEEHAAQIESMWQAVPDETLLGYHWCYGTWGGWPMTAMDDLALCVRMSNEAVRRTGRRLDYVHMPVVRRPDASFFEPLDDLDVGETKVFLGLVHHTDGIEEFRERVELARRHLPEFGIGGVCGYGRVDPGELDHVLRVHAACAAEL
jgi:hypothetical protein